MKENIKKTVKTYAIITLAALIYAVGFNWCYVPNEIGFGGITGVAQIVNALFPDLSIGMLVIVFNTPLFLLGWKFIGGGLLVSSLYAMFVSSVMIDFLTFRVGAFAPMDPMLATIYGGLLMGVSLGFIFLRGASTGGTDIIARLLQLKLPWLPLGRILMCVDFVVIMAVALAFGNVNSALFGLIALFVSTVVMDQIMYGIEKAKVAYIITNEYKAVTKRVIEELNRGVTLLYGEGGYSGDEKRILLCAFKPREIVELKRLVRTTDPQAFLIVCDAHEVKGEGFRPHRPHE